MERYITTPLLASSSSKPSIVIPANCSTTRTHSSDGCSDDLLSQEPSNLTDTRRHLTFFDGVAIVLGLQIGSGIFASPSLVVRSTGSELASLLVWAFAGLLAWACAACYIELGTRIPVNGGPQEYLACCVNELSGFLASWACIFTVKPCSAAILALFISDYICDVFETGLGRQSLNRKVVALTVLLMVTVVNCIGNKSTNLVTKVMLVCKISGVCFVLIMGFIVVTKDGLPGNSFRYHHGISNPGLGDYTDATLSAMWAYSGWETLSFVGGDIKDPGRNTSLVINFSMTIVIIISIFINIAYFSVLKLDEIVNSTSIGLTFCQHFLGNAGAAAYAIIICLSTIGTLNVKLFTAARLTQAAAERNFLPAILKTVPLSESQIEDELFDTVPQQNAFALFQRPVQYGNGSIPFSAIIFNTLIASVYVLIGNFSSLILFIGIVEYAVALATLLGLLKVRIRPRQHYQIPSSRIFKVPILLIVIAISVTAAITSISILRHPLSGFGFVLFCIASSVLYKMLIHKVHEPGN